MDERRRHGPGMPADAQQMEAARIAAVRVNEFEERREAEGIPVPDDAYLEMARATELVSRVRPNLTGAPYILASEAIAYYNLAGSFQAARRLATDTLPFVQDSPGLLSYVTELLEEAEAGIADGGSRTRDPFEPSLEKRRQLHEGERSESEITVGPISHKILAERRGVVEFEEAVAQMPTPVEPEVPIVPERIDEPVGMVPEPIGIRAPRISASVQRELEEMRQESMRNKRVWALSTEQLDEAFGWFATGVSEREIAERLGLEIKDMDALNERQNERMGTESITEAVLMGISGGRLDSSKLVKEDFDPSIFRILTDAELSLLKAYVELGGAPTKEIADFLQVRGFTVYARFKTVLEKLELSERIQAGVAYLEAQRRLGADSPVFAVRVVFRKKVEDVKTLRAEKPRTGIGSLTSREVETIEAYISGNRTTGAKLANDFNLTEGAIALRFKNIMRKLSVSGRADAAIRYLELSGRSEEAAIFGKKSEDAKLLEPRLDQKISRAGRRFGLTPMQIHTIDTYIALGMPKLSDLANHLGITLNALSVRFHFIRKDLGASGRIDAVNRYQVLRAGDQTPVKVDIAKSAEVPGPVLRPKTLSDGSGAQAAVESTPTRTEVKLTNKLIRTILTGIAQGLSTQELAIIANITADQIEKAKKGIAIKYEARTAEDVVIKFLEIGYVQAASLLPVDFDLGSLPALSAEESRVLAVYAEHFGRISNHEIGQQSGLDAVAAFRAMNAVQKKLNATNMTQVIVIALAAEKMGHKL